MTTPASPELRAAEDELKVHRGRAALLAQFIHDQAHDRDARIALAQLLGLPEPTTTSRKGNTD